MVSTFKMAGAIELKSSSKEQAFPLLKQVSQAWHPPTFKETASNRVTLCPLASAASIKAFVMARLFPFFLGLPVMTTIFLPIAMPPVFPKLTFFKAHITIIFRMMFITSTHIEVRYLQGR